MTAIRTRVHISASPRSARRRALGLLLAAVVAALAVLLPAGPASAHAVLLRTDPGSGSIVQDTPTRVTLTFNEPVQLVPADIGVVAPTGAKVGGTPTLTHDGTVLSIPLSERLPKGTFLVTYRIISADSHPVAGGFSFSIGAPSKTAPAATGGTGAAEQPVVGVAMPVVRYLGYAGMVLAVGAALVLISLWPRRLPRRGPARVMGLGVLLVAVSTLAEGYLQVPYSTGGSLTSVGYHDLVQIMNSRFGWAHLARLILLAAAVPLLSVIGAARRNRLGTGERVALAVMAALAVFTWGYGGHPSTSPVPWLTVLSDAVHLGAIAAWLGGLVMLVCFLLPRAAPRELAAVLPVWSRWATIAVSVLAAAGIVQACLQLGTPSALVQTLYGQLIIVKVVAFAAILAVASYSRSASRRYALAGLPARPAADASDGEVPVAAGASDESGVPVAGGASDEGEVSVAGGAGDAAKPGDHVERADGAERTVGAEPDDGAGSADDPDATEFTDPVWEEVYAAGSGHRDTAEARSPGAPAGKRLPGAAAGAEPEPPAEPSTVDRRALWRLILVELCIAAVILGVTAVLVQTTPARSATSAASEAKNLPYSATLNDKLFSLQVQLDPARTGKNTLHAIAYHPDDGSPVRVRQWKVTASLPSAGIGPITIPTEAITDNHAIADVALPKAGNWKFSFTLRISEIDESTVTTTVPVR
ncbi:copper resistance protein CopC [Actinocatenispora comari]|uniref:copper resistance protein CopC n=1 Tax=Actinocatenispora comari TaxID=2807577 RepID=UPI001A91FE0F|nr:copper resistance protein CopC [Actinocatenispora comari]